MKKIFSILVISSVGFAGCTENGGINEAKIDAAGSKLQKTVEKGVDTIGSKLKKIKVKVETKNDTIPNP